MKDYGVPKNTVVVDMGAFDGLLGSNSYNLIRGGWSGLLVEGLPSTFIQLNETINRMQVFEDQWIWRHCQSGFEDQSIQKKLYKLNSFFGRVFGSPKKFHAA